MLNTKWHFVAQTVLLIALILPATAFGKQNDLRVTFKEVGDKVEFYAANDLYAPGYVRVKFKELTGYKVNVKLPYTGLVPPRTKKHHLFTLTRKSRRTPASFSTLTNFSRGNPHAKHDDTHKYLYPFSHGKKFRLSQAAFSEPTHQGIYAYDFSMPVGTPVTAARAGTVISLEEKYSKGGPDPRMEKQANYIMIHHADGSMASYSHLQKNGVLVALGDKVVAGQKIGLSGNTGYSSGPHLHFHVTLAKQPGSKKKLRTLPIKFLNVAGNPKGLNEDSWYYARHPGKPDFNVRLGKNLSNEDFKDYFKPVKKTGKLKIEKEQIDSTYVLYAVNGYNRPVRIELDVTMQNMTSSRSLPYKKVLRPLSRTYLMLVKRKTAADSSFSYKVMYY